MAPNPISARVAKRAVPTEPGSGRARSAASALCKAPGQSMGRIVGTLGAYQAPERLRFPVGKKIEGTMEQPSRALMPNCVLQCCPRSSKRECPLFRYSAVVRSRCGRAWYQNVAARKPPLRRC